MDLNLLINELIEYAKFHLFLKEEDEVYIRNLILHELDVDSFKKESVDVERIKKLNRADYFVNELNNYFLSKGIEEKEIDRKITHIFGLLTPLPSEVNYLFKKIYKEKGDKEALDFLFNLSIENDYVKKSKIDTNPVWESSFPSRNIEISINLSKPEKKNSDIAKLLIKKPVGEIKYPSCQLCYDNLGYYGRDDHPARSNLRFIPLKLDNEDWNLQYSPYGYFYKHSICFKSEHSNMVINKKTFIKLLEFVDIFPDFFIGSNADLPIVGGSILNHEHYQGGKHLLPIMNQKEKKEIKLTKFKDVSLSLLDWYNTTFILKGKNKEELVKLADHILTSWRTYSDLSVDILAKEDDKLHNTVTPSVKKINDTYYIYMILRNNRQNEEYPDGIFHAHKEYHHIKQEGIGIIEAMGLFILPARLIRQENEIKDSLKLSLTDEEIKEKYPDMIGNFLDMIHELKKNYKEERIDQDIKEYIENVCKNILINTAVFKEDTKGEEALNKFIESLEL